MKPYRGVFLATAALLSMLQLSGCGDADEWETTDKITLTAVTADGDTEIVHTVVSQPPTEGIACTTLLQYRAQGAGVSIPWSDIPGTETTRVFTIRPQHDGTVVAIARGRCLEGRDEWLYSNQAETTVKFAVPEPPVLPTVTSVTLTAITASPYSKLAGGGINYTLAATVGTGCTPNYKLTYLGAGSSPNPNILTTTVVGLKNIPNGNLVGSVTGNALSILAEAWCSENATAVVSATPLSYTITN